MHSLWHRVRARLAIQDTDAELRAEIESHRALHEAALRRAGVSAAEAAQLQALRAN